MNYSTQATTFAFGIPSAGLAIRDGMNLAKSGFNITKSSGFWGKSLDLGKMALRGLRSNSNSTLLSPISLTAYSQPSIGYGTTSGTWSLALRTVNSIGETLIGRIAKTSIAPFVFTNGVNLHCLISRSGKGN